VIVCLVKYIVIMYSAASYSNNSFNKNKNDLKKQFCFIFHEKNDNYQKTSEPSE
jgi:hypothetical protein